MDETRIRGGEGIGQACTFRDTNLSQKWIERERERVDEKHLDEHRKFTHGETRKHRTDIFDLRGIRTPDEARHANFVENDGNKLAEVTLVWEERRASNGKIAGFIPRTSSFGLATVSSKIV